MSMSECKDKKKNNATKFGFPKKTAVDRLYHDSETFLYRYRWWIVLVLACMLAYYLYARKCTESGSDSGLSFFQSNTPKLAANDLNLGEPTLALNTDARRLFRL